MLSTERKKGEGVFLTIPPSDSERVVHIFVDKGRRSTNIKVIVKAEKEVQVTRCDEKGNRVGKK